MGGRGGSGRVTATMPLLEDPRAHFLAWANSNKSIPVDYVEGTNVIVQLPDHDAHLVRVSPGVYILMDDVTDKELFRGKSAPDVWEKVSTFYGGRVSVAVDIGVSRPGVKTGIFGRQGDRMKSPAAKRYGVK